MKRRSVIGLFVVIALLAGLAYVFKFGALAGIWEVKPIGLQVKDNKLGLELAGGYAITLQANSANVENFEGSMQNTLHLLRQRLDAKGLDEATVSRQGSDSFRIEIPLSVEDTSDLSSYLTAVAKIEWKDSDGNVLLTNADIKSATAKVSDGTYYVLFKFNSAGATKLTTATKTYLGKYIEIYMDGSEFSNLYISNVISTGQVALEGSFTKDSSARIANLVNNGVMPLSLTQTDQRTISATMGSDSIQRCVLGSIIGVAAVMVFLLVLYRALGLMADIALGYNVIIVFFCILTMSWVQLTVAGIAGLLLSGGLAAAANILLIEGIRKEMKTGRPAETAIKTGSRRAFVPILDSHAAALLIAAALMIFGAGTIKIFAYMLAIGAGASLFTTFVITRYLVKTIMLSDLANKKWLVRV